MKKVTKMTAVVAVLPARAQWSLDGVAEVMAGGETATYTPDKNIINSNMYRSFWATGDGYFGGPSFEIRFDLKSTI